MARRAPEDPAMASRVPAIRPSAANLTREREGTGLMRRIRDGVFDLRLTLHKMYYRRGTMRRALPTSI